MRLTEAEYMALLHRMNQDTGFAIPGGTGTLVAERPREGQPRYRSKTEARYAAKLETDQAVGQITAWWHEPVKLRLAKTCFYTPDFLVISATSPQRFEFHEVKGFWRDDARVKIKVAAAMYPCFAFLALTYVHGEWQEERFS